MVRMWPLSLYAEWKKRVYQLKREAFALYIAARDPRTPWYARLVVGLTLAHTFSPIDLIPDFIPVIGYLDDLIITPLGIALAVRLIPAQVMREARERAEAFMRQGKPVSRAGAVLVVGVWLIIVAAVVWYIAD